MCVCSEKFLVLYFVCLLLWCMRVALNDAAKNGSTAASDDAFSSASAISADNIYEYHGFYTNMPQ